MFICPNCKVRLGKAKTAGGVLWRCDKCGGRSGTVSLIRRHVSSDTVNKLWQTVRNAKFPLKRPCPACNNKMSQIPVDGVSGTELIDVCPTCQFIWFDANEYEALPKKEQAPKVEAELPQAARAKLAEIQVESIAVQADSDYGAGADSPDEFWKYIPALLGMPIEFQNPPIHRLPWVTWFFALAATLIGAYSFLVTDEFVHDFAFIPGEAGRLMGLTFVTSFLLHGGWIHLVSNMYFFLVFGDNVEDFLGKWKYLLLLISATLVGNVAHMLGDPRAMTPCVGASGGISGVIAFYALRFPRVRLGFAFLFFCIKLLWLRLPAYVMFVIWIVLQFVGAWRQLGGFTHVSALAHLGGAATGFLFWFATRKS